MKGRFLLLAAVLIVLGTMMGSANAASIIFSDDFNRNNNKILNNGWVETQNNNSTWDVRVLGKKAMLRDKNASITQTLSFSGFQNIRLDFDWVTWAAKKNNSLSVSWDQGGGNWSTLWSTGLGGSGWKNQSLTAGALDNLSNVRIKFWTSVNKSYDKVWLDNIVISGTAISAFSGTAMSAVPEPATVALLGIGIVGLAGTEVRRRRNKRKVDNS